MYIDSCNTTEILAVIAIGIGVIALTELIPVPGVAVAGDAATAILAIDGSVIFYNSAGGNGVKIRLLQNPFTKKIYPYWVKLQ